MPEQSSQQSSDTPPPPPPPPHPSSKMANRQPQQQLHPTNQAAPSVPRHTLGADLSGRGLEGAAA